MGVIRATPTADALKTIFNLPPLHLVIMGEAKVVQFTQSFNVSENMVKN